MEDQATYLRLLIPGTKPRKLGLGSRRIEVDGAGRAEVRVRCLARKGERCKGALQLATRAGRGRTIASARFSLRRGGGVVDARLSRSARRDLALTGRLRASLTATVRELGDSTRSRSTVTLVARG